LVGGMAMIAGTRTVLYFGSNGEGPHCYGEGTADKALADRSGGNLCYDPTSSDKGSHAYPYRYQIWAYDLNDLTAVKEGRKQPWEVMPYGVWPINFPIPEAKVRIGGVTYDSERQLIYVSQLRADAAGYLPIIHVLHVAAVPGSKAPTSNTVGSLSMQADKTAPQFEQTRITFSATPTGGVAPYEYQWWIYDGATWNLTQDWSGSDRFSWLPTTSNAQFQVGARVRSAGNVDNVPEATAAMPFAIAPRNSARATQVALTANRNAPQAPFTPITWSAAPVGGSAHEYKWLLSDGATWSVLSNWSSNASFVWTPGTANSRYRVGVWVRSGGNTADSYEASAEQGFAVELTRPPTPRVNSVVLTSNRNAPQAPGTTVVWSATPAGGTAPYDFKWSVFDGHNWQVVLNWGRSPTFTWTPTSANPSYRVAVWVRSAGSTNDYFEASAEQGFPVATSGSGVGPVTSVALSANRVAPQPAGTTIAWTATSNGGVGPHQYKWFVYDGSQWNVVRDWSTASTFTWTPTTPNARYRVAVWVRSAGNTNDYFQVSAENGFPIQ
jgi:hypothetical protein